MATTMLCSGQKFNVGMMLERLYVNAYTNSIPVQEVFLTLSIPKDFASLLL